MSPAQETQSMREIRLLCRRLPHKGGGLTGMHNVVSSTSSHEFKPVCDMVFVHRAYCCMSHYQYHIFKIVA